MVSDTKFVKGKKIKEKETKERGREFTKMYVVAQEDSERGKGNEQYYVFRNFT